MKPTFLIGLSALALAATASADVTINVTGATAFRSAALTTIKARYLAASSPSFKFAHDQATGSLTKATRAIFIGSFPNITGTTTIRCTFTGSVEGVRALTLANTADPTPPTYLPASVATATASSSGGETSLVTDLGAAADSDIAFSDVNKAATPYTSGSLTFDNVGAIIFTMMTNEGSTITNVTAQQYRALLTQGYQKKSLFTGIAADTSKVFVVGRNDASGTRTTAFAETGFGITNPVNQYFAKTSAGNAITVLKLADTSDTYKSTVWGQNVVGNGGYESGSSVAAVFGRTTANTQIQDDTNAESFAAGPISLVTWLGVGDASTAKNNGGVLCGYNGVSLDLATATTATAVAPNKMVDGTYYTISTTGPNFTAFGAANNNVGTSFTCVVGATAIADAGTTGAVTTTTYTMSTADKAKVNNGSYTAWGWERMIRKTSMSTGDKKTAYDAIKAAIPANISTAGMQTTELTGVKRSTDGGLVAP